MNTPESYLNQQHTQQEERLLLQPNELPLRRAYYYATPRTDNSRPTPPPAMLRETNPVTLFVRHGVIFADKTVIPVFVAQEVQDEQYH